MDRVRADQNQNPNPSEVSRNYSPSPIFFTPRELIHCIFEGSFYLWQTHDNSLQKWTDKNFLLVDPAMGNGNFPLEWYLSQNSRDTLEDLSKYLKNNFFGYEILPELIQQAEQRFIQNGIESELLHIYNRNTLETEQSTKEIQKRLERSSSYDGLIIFGNPPYAISSNSKFPCIQTCLIFYKPALNLNGKKKIVGLKGIQDDYVKFYRWGQWLLHHSAKPAILAYVSNNYFLDGDIFRGMRHYLMRQFDQIYIINLNGDPKRPPPQGKTDENVFEIQTGICIFLGFANNPSQIYEKPQAHIYYTEFFGTKQEKLAQLQESFNHLEFIQVKNRKDFEFIPLDPALFKKEEEYFNFPYLPEIFKEHIIGIQSLHDSLITHPDKDRLEQILQRFYDGTYDSHIFLDRKGQQWVKKDGVTYHDARDWKITEGKEGTLEKAKKYIYEWQWRGLDRWYVCYNEHLITKGSSGIRIMQFLFPQFKNRALIVPRVSRKTSGKTSILVTTTLADSHCIEGGSGIGDYIFPEKINHQVSKKVNWNHPLNPIESNLTPWIKNGLQTQYSISLLEIEKEIFPYIYGILWCPDFSEDYAFLIRKDFPHIPFPVNYADFKQIAILGEKLARIHSFEFDSNQMDLLQSRFISSKNDWIFANIFHHPEISDRKETTFFVQQPYYDVKAKTLFFDKKMMEKGFWVRNISQEIWKFEIGGYRQLSQWLKHRTYQPLTSMEGSKNSIIKTVPTHLKRYQFTRGLTADEIFTFLKICWIIFQTIQIRKNLNEVYQQIHTSAPYWLSLSQIYEDK